MALRLLLGVTCLVAFVTSQSFLIDITIYRRNSGCMGPSMPFPNTPFTSPTCITCPINTIPQGYTFDCLNDTHVMISEQDAVCDPTSTSSTDIGRSGETCFGIGPRACDTEVLFTCIPLPTPTPSPSPFPTPSPSPFPTPSPSPSPTPFPIPSPSPFPIPSPTPFPIPSPTPFPIPSPTPFPIPSPTPLPTPTPTPTTSSTPFPTPTPTPTTPPTPLPTPTPTPTTPPTPLPTPTPSPTPAPVPTIVIHDDPHSGSSLLSPPLLFAILPVIFVGFLLV